MNEGRTAIAARVGQFAKPLFLFTEYLVSFTMYVFKSMNKTCGDVWRQFASDKLYSRAEPNRASYTTCGVKNERDGSSKLIQLHQILAGVKKKKNVLSQKLRNPNAI